MKTKCVKKVYSSPLLVIHGDLRKITRKGGRDFTDVPEGTPVDDDITNVAS